MQNSFKSPDFAFPETVATNAREALDQALEKHDYPNAICALMQISVANSLVRDTDIATDLAMIDSLASEMPAPYSQVMYALEARLLTSFYQANEYNYSKRNLPLDNPPEDYGQWSKDLFAQRILELSRQAMAEPKAALQTPITTIQPILRKLDNENIAAYPTVLDFLACSTLQSLNPFGNTDTLWFGNSGKADINRAIDELKTSTIKMMIDIHSRLSQSVAEAMWIIKKADSLDSDKFQYLMEQADAHKADAGCVPLLIEAYKYTGVISSEEGLKNCTIWFEAAKNARNDFSSEYQTPTLATYISDLLRPSFDIECPDRFLSAQPIKITAQLTNSQKACIAVYRVPDGQETVEYGSLYTQEPIHLLPLSVSTHCPLPFYEKTEAELPPLSYGKYAVVAMPDDDFRRHILEHSGHFARVLTVSDIMPVESYDHKSGKARMYFCNAANMKPLAGVKVNFSPKDKYSGKAFKAITNEQGYIAVPDSGNWCYEAKLGNDRLSQTYYANRKQWHVSSESTQATILTDLSVYHPGDSVGLAVVLYNEKDRQFSMAGEQDILLKLLDTNGKIVDTKEVRTDEFGRAEAKFEIPKECVNGTFQIIAHALPQRSELPQQLEGQLYPNRAPIGSARVQVADYVAPKFFVELEAGNADFKAGDTVRLKGRVMTYSGMPVAEASVDYSVSYQSWWLWGGSSTDASYGASTKTGGDGTFEIVLPTENLKASRYARGSFRLDAKATSPAGETQAAEPFYFALGTAVRIGAYIPNKICADSDDGRMTVKTEDLLGRQKSARVEYRITDLSGNDIVEMGGFESPDFTMPLAKLPSSRYRIVFSASEAEDVAREFTVWRSSDAVAPYETPLWVPQTSIVAEPGADHVEAIIGSGYPDSWILCQISNCEKVVEEKWLEVKQDGRNLKVLLPVPTDNNRNWVKLMGVHNFASESCVIEILPASSQDKLKCEVITFRDKLVPTTHEKWTFRFTDNDGNGLRVPAIAVMTDKALNAIQPFHWFFAPQIYYNSVASLNRCLYLDQIRDNWQGKETYIRNIVSYNAPEWNYSNFFSRGWRASYGYGTLDYCLSIAPMRNEKISVRQRQVTTDSFEEMEMEIATAFDDESVAGGTDDTSASPEAVRDIECPLAFFQPMLVSNDDGTLDINFDVPDFNTTWQFQLLGYTPSLLTSIIRRDAIASKPVMVQSNVPRFLRTGDDTSIRALLMNNSEEPQAVGGKIEIFNPLTGCVIECREFEPETLPAKGSRTVALDFKTPSDIQLIGFRAWAISEQHRDGEQTLIGILPSSSPVIESTPFYLSRSAAEIETTLPEYPADASVTLTMCSNPVWTCITALPEISSGDSASVLDKVRALFANAVAAHLVNKYPAISQALKYWENHPKDAVLLSNLAKNDDLKTLALSQTIWTVDAVAETLRMENLRNLLDTTKSQAAIDRLMQEIQDKQTSQGGWSWCDDMEPSPYITSRMLLNFAALKGLGALPEEYYIWVMIGGAINFCDAEIYADYKRCEKYYRYASLSNYLYVRSFFPDIKYKNAGWHDLERRALRAIAKDWRSLDIYDKATAAILLHRKGYKKECSLILESLRQMARKDPQQGIWYENISSGFNSFPRLITNVQVLEAFTEAAPNDTAMIDGLRQWLILQRQVQNWVQESYTAEVVSAILSTQPFDADLMKTVKPQVTLNDNLLEIPESDPFTGEFRLSLPAAEASGAMLKVDNSGNPAAWGGVIARFIKPMAEVTATDIPQISVTKAVYAIDESAQGTTLSEITEMKVGQKVRVMLFVTTDRDMDYVALTDERAACLEPTEQLSHYTGQDGLWFFREVKNDKTNLFFSFLPKGKHVVSYDCYVSQEGLYALGIATTQSLYAPTIVAHSSGTILKVKE